MAIIVNELTDDAPVGATITTGAREPVTIPASRYTDPAFAALEMERLWPRVWQVACSADHVASPGDVYEYRCGPYSTLIVRGDDGGLRAFQNACRHRGSAICEGKNCRVRMWWWGLRPAERRRTWWVRSNMRGSAAR